MEWEREEGNQVRTSVPKGDNFTEVSITYPPPHVPFHSGPIAQIEHVQKVNAAVAPDISSTGQLETTLTLRFAVIGHSEEPRTILRGPRWLPRTGRATAKAPGPPPCERLFRSMLSIVSVSTS